jgi:hypothetical protein
LRFGTNFFPRISNFGLIGIQFQSMYIISFLSANFLSSLGLIGIRVHMYVLYILFLPGVKVRLRLGPVPPTLKLPHQKIRVSETTKELFSWVVSLWEIPGRTWPLGNGPVISTTCCTYIPDNTVYFNELNEFDRCN